MTLLVDSSQIKTICGSQDLSNIYDHVHNYAQSLNEEPTRCVFYTKFFLLENKLKNLHIIKSNILFYKYPIWN